MCVGKLSACEFCIGKLGEKLCVSELVYSVYV